jgi:PKD repeat protein
MYTPGIVACLLVILLIGASGCSVLSHAAKPGANRSISGENALAETPTLPDQYVAQPAGVSETVSPGIAPTTVQVNQSNQSPPVLSPAQLTTITGSGLSGTSSGTSNLSIPGAQFNSNINMGFAPLTVQFTDTSLNLPTGWSWDFGDGNSSTMQNPINTYYTGGLYTVNLTTFNGAGLSTYSSTVSVYSPAFYVIPHGNRTFTFIDNGTGYPQPSSWFWDFGDIGAGNTSNQQNWTHQYGSPDTYFVKFRITSLAGIAWVNQSLAV